LGWLATRCGRRWPRTGHRDTSERRGARSADAYEPQVRALLVQWPRTPGPVIAQRIGWPYSEGPLKKLLARIRPEYVGIDPVDQVSYQPGQLAQCDLWFPAPTIPVSPGQGACLAGVGDRVGILPVPVRDDDPVASGPDMRTPSPMRRSPRPTWAVTT
jgi:hypothetical protein